MEQFGAWKGGRGTVGGGIWRSGRSGWGRSSGNFWLYDEPVIWKLLHWVSWIVFVPFIGLLLWSLIPKKNRPARPIAQNAGRLRFPIDRVQMWLLDLLCVESLLLAPKYLRHGFHVSSDFVTGALFCMLAVASLIEVPRTVMTSDAGIEEVHSLGRNKFIRWEDIEEINIGKRDRVITIRSKKRTKIVYTMRPEHQAQFLYEIKRRCGDELPPEFPGESLSESENG